MIDRVVSIVPGKMLIGLFRRLIPYHVVEDGRKTKKVEKPNMTRV